MAQTGGEKSPRVWYALEVEVEPMAAEAIQYALMEAGSVGTENLAGGRKITGWFDHSPPIAAVHEALIEGLQIYRLPPSSILSLRLFEAPERDWLSEWKKAWQPVTVERFIIAPPWAVVADAREKIVIRIEPGMAFGTGTHETTRLCLQVISRFFRGGSFLDVGTGTGILAIAAARLYPMARVEACDADPAAIEIAAENARLNDVADRISFRTGSIDDSIVASADFVCANLTTDVIIPLLPKLVGATCGRLVLSGILETQADGLIEQLPEQKGAGNLVVMQQGEWIALVI